MNFLCPKCGKNNLKITDSIKIEPGIHDDEKLIQIVVCSCGFEGIAAYEESRRGAEDIFNHRGYFVPKNKINELKKAIENGEKISAEHFIINKETGYSHDGFEIK